LTKNYFECLNFKGKFINSNSLDNSIQEINKECSKIQKDYEKCKIIHDRLDSIFENKQKVYLDDLRVSNIKKQKEKDDLNN